MMKSCFKFDFPVKKYPRYEVLIYATSAILDLRILKIWPQIWFSRRKIPQDTGFHVAISIIIHFTQKSHLSKCRQLDEADAQHCSCGRVPLYTPSVVLFSKLTKKAYTDSQKRYNFRGRKKKQGIVFSCAIAFQVLPPQSVKNGEKNSRNPSFRGIATMEVFPIRHCGHWHITLSQRSRSTEPNNRTGYAKSG